ncbi:MAG: hypothetical protein HZB65_03985 [Candidatus Aenigmarchaeota archaeon]|nr:hypothetical protein [Candidatus Aenigmarchaeota archaeon]
MLKSFTPVDKISVTIADYNSLINYDTLIIVHKYPELTQETLIKLANNGVALALLTDAKEYADGANFDSSALVRLYE